MNYLNSFDIGNLQDITRHAGTPNLRHAADTLANLAEWANANSDGWAYWQKPRRAADRLATALVAAENVYRTGAHVADISDADLAHLYRPIRSFLTRCANQGIADRDAAADILVIGA